MDFNKQSKNTNIKTTNIKNNNTNKQKSKQNNDQFDSFVNNIEGMKNNNSDDIKDAWNNFLDFSKPLDITTFLGVVIYVLIFGLLGTNAVILCSHYSQPQYKDDKFWFGLNERKPKADELNEGVNISNILPSETLSSIYTTAPLVGDEKTKETKKFERPTAIDQDKERQASFLLCNFPYGPSNFYVTPRPYAIDSHNSKIYWDSQDQNTISGLLGINGLPRQIGNNIMFTFTQLRSWLKWCMKPGKNDKSFSIQDAQQLNFSNNVRFILGPLVIFIGAILTFFMSIGFSAWQSIRDMSNIPHNETGLTWFGGAFVRFFYGIVSLGVTPILSLLAYIGFIGYYPWVSNKLVNDKTHIQENINGFIYRENSKQFVAPSDFFTIWSINSFIVIIAFFLSLFISLHYNFGLKHSIAVPITFIIFYILGIIGSSGVAQQKKSASMR